MDTIKINVSKKVNLRYLMDERKNYICLSLFISNSSKENLDLSVLAPYIINYSKPMELFCEKYCVDNRSADIFQVGKSHIFQSSMVISAKLKKEKELLSDLFITISDIFSLEKWKIDYKLADEARIALKYKVEESLKDSNIYSLNEFFEEINPSALSTGILPVNSKMNLAKLDYSENYINEFFKILFENVNIDIYISGNLNIHNLHQFKDQIMELPYYNNELEVKAQGNNDIKSDYKEIINKTNEELDTMILGYKLQESNDNCLWRERIILDSIIASLPQSRITKKLNKMGLVYLILSGVDWVGGYLWILVKCKKNNSLRVKEIIQDEIDNIKHEQIDDNEFNIIKESSEIRFKIGIDSNIFMRMRFEFELNKLYPNIEFKDCFESLNTVTKSSIINQVKNMQFKIFYWNKGLMWSEDI